MRKILFSSFFLFLISIITLGQSIEDVKGLGKISETKLVSLLSDHSIWWSPEGKAWQKVPLQGLPANSSMKLIEVYVKFAGTNKNTRLVAVLEDNSMWWYADGGSWEKISTAGLPKNAVVKIFKPYVKTGSFGSLDTRFVVVLDNNTMWWYALDEPWRPVSSEGLPAGYVITNLGSYQKVGMMGTETRYMLTLSDNSVWWFAEGKKWQQLESSGLPANSTFKKFTAYMKISGDAIFTRYATWEGRLVGVLSDESIWWFATNGKTWKKLETNGLPKGYKIRSLSVFQKYPGMMGETRVILLLEDNSVWWYGENKGWSKVNTTGLPLSN